MIPARAWSDAQLLWDFQQMHHDLRPCSVGIGLGSHDLGVADVTADLYQRGMFPLIVFTGATSRTTRERMPRGEAEHYRERAIELGVPAGAILVEPEARNTGENIILSRAALAQRGIDVTSVLLVSKPYEERRAYATACKLWPRVEFISASAAMTLAEYVDTLQDPRLVLDMLVGAQQRLVVYPKQGFMIDQEVPRAVAAAYERLCADGFTSRLAPEG
ncbi:YdcF family protein [Streptomyces sp. AM 2-1-1]|uniref:YdcF family protein n=1 Tax=Streptomyces sp. AM 2-1-1 TaxID=3028709 RepID=UPI0023B9258A|nr:YdcF family protein [Streptomyces sp. AM 2-1-1]WEH40593.1 YdcF family protein [Streptomyces sp. AM 2-1-1]